MDKNKSFKYLIKRISIKYSIIPIFIILIFMSIIAYYIFKYREIEIATKSNKELLNRVNQEFNSIIEEIKSIDKLDNYMEKGINNNKPEIIYNRYYKFQNSTKLNVNLEIYTNNKLIFHTFKDRDKLYLDNNTEWERISLSDDISFVITNNFKNNNSMVSFFEKKSYYLGETYNFRYYIDENSLVALINSESSTINSIIGNYEEVIATNQIGVKGKVNKFLPRKIDFMKVNYSDNEYYFKEDKLDNIPIYLITMAKISPLNSIAIYYFIAIFILLMISIFIETQVSKVISEKSVSALDKMMISITEAKKGKLTSVEDGEIFDEFKFLYNEYNKMLLSIEQLIEKNKKMANINRIDELKFLNSQFNPHFMFNTLESLKYLVKFDPQKANEYIVDLSKILRYTIKSKDFFSTIKDEIDYLVSYLNLQKMRYEDSMKFSVNVDENMFEYKIPKLIIQPIVENSIKYTYMIQNNLNIIVSIYEVDEDVVIEIFDNGAGMTRQQLDNLYKNFENQISSRGIGLYNVNKKLGLLYDHYQFDIENCLNGLLVRIVFEKRGKDV